MLVFIDETGDLGFDFTQRGTSSHFVITALVLQSHRDRISIEKSVARTIKNKINLRKSGAKAPEQELKGHKSSHLAKLYFWRQVESIPFGLYCVVLNKERVYPSLQRQKERLYNFIARLVVDNIPIDECGDSLHVEIDKSKGRRERDEFNDYMQRHIQARVEPHVRISIYHVLSNESRAIQAADMFSWGIARKYQRGDLAWYDVFAPRISFETLYLPPQPRN